MLNNKPDKKALLEIQTILEKAEDKNIPSGEYIFKEGEDHPFFYIVLRGEIEILKNTSEGKEKVIAHVRTGDILGEGVLAGVTKKPTAARAKDDVNLLAISYENFQEVASQDSEAAINFLLSVLGTVNDRLRQVDEQIIALFEINQILNMYRDDLNKLSQAIVTKVIQLTESEDGILFIKHPPENTFRTVVSTSNLLTPELFSEGELKNPQVLERNDGHFLVANLNSTGYLALKRSKENKAFDAESLRVLVLIADQTAKAIENAFHRASDKARNLLEQKRIVL